MENNNNTQLPKITREYLASLPTSTLIVGDKERQCKIDSTNGTVYLLDEDGNYTGRFTRKPEFIKKQQESAKKMDISGDVTAYDGQEETPKKPTIPEKPSEKDPPERQEPDTEEEEPDHDDDENDEGDEKQKPEEDGPGKKKKNKILLIAGIAVAVFLVFSVISALKTVFVIRSNEGKETGATTGATTAVTEATEPTYTTDPTVQTLPETPTDGATEPATEPAEEPCYVLTAANTLLPGHKLRKQDFALTEMTKDEYYRLCFGGGIYTKEQLDLLVGMEVTDYIPAGQFIAYDAVASEYAPVNPWGRTDVRQMTVRLPVMVEAEQLMSYMIGNCMDVTIVIQTKITTPSDGNDEENEDDNTEGMEHHTSIVESMLIDTYIVQAAVVVDLLDQNGKSLFPQYTSLATIPVVFQKTALEEQYNSEESLKELIPCYIVIAVTTEQGTMIQTLSPDNMTVTIGTGEATVTNELQKDAYQQLQELMKTVKALWDALKKEK